MIQKSKDSFVEYNLLQEAHGPHRSPEKTVQINNHIWLYHNVDYEKKKPIINF